MRKILLVCLGLFLFMLQIQAQHNKSTSTKKLEATADEFFRVGEYTHALNYYLQVDSLQPNQGRINYQIGICIFSSEIKSRSLKYFQKAKELGYITPDLPLYFARALHLNHKFEEAIAVYQSYAPDTLQAKSKKSKKEPAPVEVDEQDLSRGEIELRDIKKDVPRYIHMCETGIKLMEDSLTLVIENIGPTINSKYPDYVPVVSADETELIFTSRRPNTTGGKLDPQDDHYFEDVYITTKDSTTKTWKDPEDMGPHVNSPLHDACIGLSPDGHKLFIYRSDYSKKAAGDIYVSNLEGEVWSTPTKMEDNINSPDWEPSATISADEKTLYFVSNREGGMGGTDIYMVKLQDDGKWGVPINMGPTVNTEYDEDAPYIHPDNKTLFFSSRGHNTMGGFDIFTSVYNDSLNQWSKAENAGYPINTADEDIYFVWSADGTKGYFSSWRADTYGEKDIYVIHRPKGSTNLVIFKGHVYDIETRKPLASVITIKNSETNELIGVFNSNSETGKFVVVLPHGTHYSITVEADGYMFYSDAIHVARNTPFFEVKKDIYLQPVKEGQSIVLNNIFYEFDKSILRKESLPELDNLYAFLVKYPDLKVEISGHTDSYGSDLYNQKLSQKRAESVVAWLIAKGIPKERLVAKGYGESRPIQSNDTPEGRQMNRRTELKIIDGNFNVMNEYNNVAIQYKNEFTGEVDRSGKPGNDNSGSTTTNTSGVQYKKGEKYYIPLSQPSAEAVLKPKVHFVYKVSNSLTVYSSQRADELVEIMNQYPNMKVKVVAWTVTEGEMGTLNKDLAEKRAKTVMDYLVKKGIDPARLSTDVRGHKPDADPKNNGEQNIHNRMVEFVVQ